MIVSEKGFKANISYEVNGNTITFNGAISLNLSVYERDDDVHIDICESINGTLTTGVTPGFASKYAAQIDIPARKYETLVEENNGDDEELYETLVPVPFNMDNVVLSI